MARRVLLLGGTSEARALAERLAGRTDLAVTLSLAGRTLNPAPQPVPVRVGGFGGVEGLKAHLMAERVEAVIDATHPYAAQMSIHAAEACRAASVPLLALRRPPWAQQAGDLWTIVPDVAAAVEALGTAPRRVFLALGRNEVRAFERAPWHSYLVRSVDPIDPPLAVPDVRYVLGRGPFSEADDLALLRDHRIAVLVAKNSGGSATYGKMAAARALGLTSILIARPPVPDVPAVANVADAVDWLDALFAAPPAHEAASAERGA